MYKCEIYVMLMITFYGLMTFCSGFSNYILPNKNKNRPAIFFITLPPYPSLLYLLNMYVY